MISNRFIDLQWKVNANPVLGFPAGAVACVRWRAGGGFAGAPEELWIAPIALVMTIGSASLPTAEFPDPGPSVLYHVGGHDFSKYAYAPPGVEVTS